jgi:alpha-beta hydrolase superfamily lysophospholipase
LIARCVLAAALLLGGGAACAQDHEREARWAEQTLATLVAGDAVYLMQRSGHRFLALHLPARQPRGAVIIGHGRGWSPDYDLYGALRTKLADAGYSTLSIQLPVLPSTAKVGDYLPTFPDAAERYALAADWMRKQGHARIAIVSHSLGATMANHYLIRDAASPVGAWVFIGIINGLEDMFRLRIPVLDVYGENDWDVTRVGAGERLAQIRRTPGSRQVMVPGAQHFFEGRHDELTRVIVEFLDSSLPAPR